MEIFVICLGNYWNEISGAEIIPKGKCICALQISCLYARLDSLHAFQTMLAYLKVMLMLADLEGGNLWQITLAEIFLQCFLWSVSLLLKRYPKGIQLFLQRYPPKSQEIKIRRIKPSYSRSSASPEATYTWQSWLCSQAGVISTLHMSSRLPQFKV